MSGRAGLNVVLVGVNAPGYSSLALAYLRAYGEADRRLENVTFFTVDLDTSVDAWWIAYRVLALEPDVVAFSVVCWNARAVYEAARILREARQQVLLVAGGPEVGPIAEQVLRERSALDAVVRGEGEVTFSDVLACVLEEGDLPSVAGVTGRRDGEIVSAPDRDLVQDLDELPSPYLSRVMQARDGATYLESYRGCPFRCAYCFESKGYDAIRWFSDARIAEEVALVASSRGVKSFSFIDPVFNLTEERLSAVADAMEPHARRGIRLHTIEIDIEKVGREQAAKLKRAGVATVETGPQTVGASALQTCARRFDRERFAAGVRACTEAGISVECDLIIGLPGDTADDVIRGIDFVIGLDPGKVQLSTLHVLPGTALWERAAELGLAFDPEPPHEVIRTRDLGYADLRRLEVYGSAAVRAYQARR
jgi:anaerobic magnesium-protoporphyrin IX monomethyl ester cyclase